MPLAKLFRADKSAAHLLHSRVSAAHAPRGRGIIAAWVPRHCRVTDAWAPRDRRVAVRSRRVTAATLPRLASFTAGRSTFSTFAVVTHHAPAAIALP